MKKLCAILLALTMLTAASACDDGKSSSKDNNRSASSKSESSVTDNAENDTQSSTDTPSDSTDVDADNNGPSSESETSVNSTSPSENEETPSDIEAPSEIPYRMAKLHKDVVVDDEFTMTNLWIAVEILTPEWSAAYYDYELDITYDITGQSVSDLTDINYLMNDELFIESDCYGGFVCTYDHIRGQEAPEEYENLAWGEDRYVITLWISSNRDIDFDDFTFTMGMNHYPTGTDVIHEFDYNADISEITTDQSVIHEGALFELDGDYYIIENGDSGYDDNHSFTSETPEVYKYFKHFDVICITGGSTEKLAKSLDGKTQLVNGPENGYYAKDAMEFPEYLQPVTPGETFTGTFVEAKDEETIRIGFTSDEEYSYDEEIVEIIRLAIPEYTSDSGEKRLFALNYIWF